MNANPIRLLIHGANGRMGQALQRLCDEASGCNVVAAVSRKLADAAGNASPPMLTLKEYEGVGHGFNLPNASRKDVPAAQDAMKRTIAQLRQDLSAEAAK